MPAVTAARQHHSKHTKQPSVPSQSQLGLNISTQRVPVKGGAVALHRLASSVAQPLLKVPGYIRPLHGHELALVTRVQQATI